MNKKGFTLVELLAVIAILAIMVIIALPNVLEMFNDAKENTFYTEVESIYKQAQTDFINDSLNESGERTYCNITDSTYGVCPEGSKKLKLTTTKNYIVMMRADGYVRYIGVADQSFVYGDRYVSQITDLRREDVVDASNEKVKNKFKLYLSVDDNPEDYIETTNCINHQCLR